MKLKIAIALFTAILCLLSPAARADFLSLSNDGVRIDGGSMGAFTLQYPLLVSGSGAVDKILDKSINGNTTTVKYDSGATATVLLQGNDVTYTFAGVPDEVKEMRYAMDIPFALDQGGQWKFGKKDLAPFPQEKPPKPHLFQGNVGTFTLVNFDNNAFSMTAPDSFDYLELTDLREWNNQLFNFLAHVPWNSNHPSYQFTIVAGDTPGKSSNPLPPPPPDVAANQLPPGTPAPKTLVDEFGQIKLSDWPDKVHSEDELAADVKSEADYYNGLTPPTFDKYGGQPDSGKALGLKATGFFHVEQHGDRWALVDPDGNLFFHLGLCSFQPGDDYTTVASRKHIYDWLPEFDSKYKTAFHGGGDVFSFHSANMIRKYGKPITFADFQSTMIDRVRKWGFNSVGAFSGTAPEVIQAKNFPYVSSLPISQWGKIPITFIPGISGTWDPFDPNTVTSIDKAFADDLPQHADDPLLIGYFLTNEPLYEDIPKVVPTLKGSQHACKLELVRELSDKYQNIEAFNQAWGTTATSFDDLKNQALNVKTKQAFADVNAFYGKFLETYYKLVSDTFHKYDTHHMLIGDRFQSGTINNEQLCTIAGKYLDIMSFNYYTYALDKDFLKRIYKWTGRPMFLSEFFYGSAKESGLTGGNDNGTQQGRGLAYRNYIEQSATLGFVVGAEWFQLMDEASTGRWYQGFNGERGNCGLISVTDRPYKPMLAEMIKTNYDIYDVLAGKRPPFVLDDPRFSASGSAKQNTEAPHAKGPITLDGATQNWPSTPAVTISGQHVVQGTDSGGTSGAFKICWDDKYLYLLVNVVDPTPMLNTQAPADLWNGDGLEIFLGGENVDDGGTLLFSDRHLLIGASAAGKVPFYYGNSPQQYDCQTILVPSGDGKGYTIEAAIPWEAIGITPKVGTKFLFDIGIDDTADASKGRQHQIMWNGTMENSRDRTHWGTATLLE